MSVSSKPTTIVPPYVTEQQLSELIGVPIATLRSRRCREPHLNPPCRFLGRRIIYKWSEVEEWLDSQPTAKAGR